METRHEKPIKIEFIFQEKKDVETDPPKLWYVIIDNATKTGKLFYAFSAIHPDDLEFLVINGEDEFLQRIENDEKFYVCSDWVDSRAKERGDDAQIRRTERLKKMLITFPEKDG